MSIIPARIWANQMHRTDVQAARRSAGRGRALARDRPTASACSARSASRTPMRWRCRARSAEKLGIRSIADLAAHARRTLHRRRLRILRASGMEGDPRRLWPAFPPAAHHAVGLHVPGRGQRRRRRGLGLHQRRPHRANTISSCSTIPSTPSRPMTRSCCSRRAAPHDEKLIAALKPLIGAIPVDADARGQFARGGRRRPRARPPRWRRWLWRQIGNSASQANSVFAFELVCARLCVMLRMQSAASIRAMVPSPMS